MSRPIDHLVVPCRDLGRAAAEFERLGFQVGRRNRHPWGTENHVIQFEGAFVELIALAADYRPLRPEDDAFPFAGFLAGQAASADPSGMVVLRSADARGDAADFAERGIGAGRMLDFKRDAAAPDGAIRTVAFTLAFADAPSMPDLGFFVCQQHYPENFWNPAFQVHPNGVTRLAGVVIVAADPAAQADFLGGFAGQPGVVIAPDAASLDTGGGLIEVVTPDGFATRFGATMPQRPTTAPFLGAIRFATMDYAAIPRLVGEAGRSPVESPNGWVARPEDPAHPALVFGPEG